MAGFDYAKSGSTALRLIERFGRSGSLRRTVPGTGPAHNPGDPVVTSYPCTFAVMEFKLSDRDGTHVKAGDKMAYIAAANLAVEPATTDKLVAGSEIYTIAEVRPLSPAGVAVYYEVTCRR
jgi:hypothetical protein